MKGTHGKWNVLIILSLAMFIAVIDTTIMNVSIGALVEDLNTTVTGIQSAITLYTLIMASLFITGSKVGDIIGRKKAFIIGLIIYGTGTTLTAFAPNLIVLLIGWSVLEGIGAAMIMPILQTLMRGNYEKKDLPICYGTIGAVTAGAAALGPIVGGFLTTYFTWRYAFLGELAVVIVVLIGMKIVKDVPYESENKPKLDFVGIFLSVVGLGSIVLGILQAQTYGFWHAQQPFMINGQEFAPFGLSISAILIMFGLVVIAIFGWWQLRREKNNKEPLVDMNILRIKGVKPGLISANMQAFAQMGTLFTLPILLQLSFGFSAFQTGVIMLPLSIALLITSLWGAKLSSKMYPRTITALGFALMVIGIFLIINNTQTSIDSTKLWPGLTVMGAGMGLVVSQLFNIVLSLVPENKSGETASLLSTSQQLGASLGTALAGTILMITLSMSVANLASESTVLSSQQQETIIEATDTGIELVSDEQLTQALSDLPEEIATEALQINEASRINAIKMALFTIATITTIGVISSIWLPKKKFA
jgi:EmrB/QacA subfamily drug resistance transporter